MSVVEMLTVILTAAACYFAMSRSQSVSREYWHTHAAAFGCSILVLGLGGTTQLFLDGMAATIGTSEASRRAAFDAIVESAYRPLIFSVVGLMLFVVFLRSASLGDSAGGRPVAGWASSLIVLITSVTLGLTMAYHLGFVLNWNEVLQNDLLQWTLYATLASLVMCAVGAMFAVVAVGSQADNAAA